MLEKMESDEKMLLEKRRQALSSQQFSIYGICPSIAKECIITFFACSNHSLPRDTASIFKTRICKKHQYRKHELLFKIVENKNTTP